MLKLIKVSKHYDFDKNLYKSIVDTLLNRKSLNHQSFCVLNDISFELRDGKSIGIIGRNGSGKSTLLQIISKTLMPSMGHVEAIGKMTSILELGAGFNHSLTGYENINITLGIWNFESKAKTKLISEIIEFSGLNKFINQSLDSYSSGMLVRLAFSLCTVVKPDILVIDEALAVGDQLFQSKCIRRIKELQSQGTSLVLVSHSPDLIKSMCDTVLVLEEGNMKFFGNAREGINYYEKTILYDLDKKINSSLKYDKNNYKNISNRAELLFCKIVNECNEEVESIVEGDSINVSICVKHNSFVDDPHYGIRIVNSNGEIVYGTTTYSNQVFAKEKYPGEKVFILFKITNYLRNDTYSLSVGCTNHGIGYPNIAWKEFLFLIHDVCMFSITSSNKGRWEGHSLLNTEIIIDN